MPEQHRTRIMTSYRERLTPIAAGFSCRQFSQYQAQLDSINIIVRTEYATLYQQQ